MNNLIEIRNITLCILVIQKYQKENTLYQNSKHETKDAEYHELQEFVSHVTYKFY